MGRVERAEYLDQLGKDNIGIGRFEVRCGKEKTRKRGRGIGIDTAERILGARDGALRFRKLEEIEAAEGVNRDKSIELVNA